MENQSTTSQRVRPILRAMERSIDEARRKRGGTESTAHSTSPTTHAQSMSNAPANHPTPTPSTPQPAAQPTPPQANIAQTPQNAPHTFGSYNPQANQSQGDQANPDQPVRLKARPKRWQSATA